MAKRGRPPKDDSRDYQYCLRLNDVEKARLNRLCEMTGMGKSDAIRTALEKYETEEKNRR